MAQDKTGEFRVGLVQMCTGRSVEKNLADAGALIREAARQGAQYVHRVVAHGCRNVNIVSAGHLVSEVRSSCVRVRAAPGGR